MKSKIILLVIMTCASLAGHSQKNSKKSSAKEHKCVMYHNTEADRDLYKWVDIYPRLIDTTTSETQLIVSNFKFPDKKYKNSLKVRFTWIIEKDGKSTFVKIWWPDDDKEIEEEVKRFVDSLPLYKPAMCEQEPVAYKVDIEFPLDKKGIFKLGPENKK